MRDTGNMGHRSTRWKLLASSSAAALLVSAYTAGEAQAADSDSDRPQIWIEVGGQLERLDNSESQFAPPFMNSITNGSMLSALDVQRSPTYAIGGEGKISFQPDGSDWIFSASLRYGRSKAVTEGHQTTPNAKIHASLASASHYQLNSKYPSYYIKFANASAKQSEQHLILDFQAGKDVGLGLFGSRGTSVLSAGIRIGQLTSKSSINMRAQPDVHYRSAPLTSVTSIVAFEKYDTVHFHNYAAMANIQRGFRGIGPSVSWNASMPFAGTLDDGEVTFDWGLDSALLFGRQKVSGHHQTTTKSFYRRGFQPGLRGSGGINGGQFQPISTVVHHALIDLDRSQSVTVPNLGGFAGISMRYSDVNLSLGYRADFFFSAIDGGIDTRKEENRGFFGPFASISVGIGD